MFFFILSLINISLLSCFFQIIYLLQFFGIFINSKLNLVLVDILLFPFIFTFLSTINNFVFNVIVYILYLFEVIFDFLIFYF